MAMKGKCPSDYQRLSISFTGKEEHIWKFLKGQFNPRYYIKALIYEDMIRKGLIDEKDIYERNR